MKVMTTDQLLDACDQSIVHNFNRSIYRSTLEDEGVLRHAWHVVSFAMPHEHIAGVYVWDTLPHYRCRVVVGFKGDDGTETSTITLDITKELYDSLAEGEDIAFGTYGLKHNMN